MKTFRDADKSAEFKLTSVDNKKIGYERRERSSS